MEDFQGLGVNVQVHTRFYRVIFFKKKGTALILLDRIIEKIHRIPH
jgi:hypothetical protein